MARNRIRRDRGVAATLGNALLRRSTAPTRKINSRREGQNRPGAPAAGQLQGNPTAEQIADEVCRPDPRLVELIAHVVDDALHHFAVGLR